MPAFITLPIEMIITPLITPAAVIADSHVSFDV